MKKHVIFFALIVLITFALVPTGTAALDELAIRRSTRLLKYSEIEESVGMILPQADNTTLSCDDWGQVERWRGNKWICPADPKEFLILVNADHYLGREHYPDDMVLVGSRHRLRARAAYAFSLMQDSMSAEGLFLTVRSGFRTYGDQRALFNRAVNEWGYNTAARWWARPGHSEHQTGLALDIVQEGRTSPSLNSARFENTEQYAWLMENAHNYGFIMRYPEEYESITGIAFEPWHWRYIGVESATYMKENGFTVFEKYIEHREMRSAEY